MVNSGLMTSTTAEWETPQVFYDCLELEFGFTLDAAATAENAKCDRYWAVEDNALERPWSGVVWCNPPYGRVIGDFVAKGYREAQMGSVVVMLIPARTDTRYWHRFVMHAKEIRFVKGRLYFRRGDKVGRAPFPSAIVVFGHGQHRPRISSYAAGLPGGKEAT